MKEGVKDTVIWVTAQARNITSGPGRVARILSKRRGSLNFLLKLCSDQFDEVEKSEFQIKSKKIFILNRFPGYWLIRSVLFYFSIRKYIKDDKIVFSNAFEAFCSVFFRKNNTFYVLVNDYKYLNSPGSFNIYLRDYGFKKAISRRLGFFVERYVLCRAKAVITCSDYLKNIIICNYGLNDENVKTLYPAIENVFKGNQHRKKLSGDYIKLLFFKNDFRIGGLFVIIKSLIESRASERYELHIAGISHRHKKSVLNFIQNSEFRGRFVWYGLLNSTEDVLKLYQKVDCLVSCSRQEAFGITLIESASVGLPIIATKVGGIREATLNGKTAILIPPPVKENLVFLFSNPSEFSKIISDFQDCSLLIRSTFSEDNMILRLQEILF